MARSATRLILASVDTYVRKLKTHRGRLRMRLMVEALLRGSCAICEQDILYPETAQPTEPLKICLPCGRANVAAGDLLFWDDQRPTKKARKRRPGRPDGR